ncbi:DNA-directed RNA polymerase subunit alpha [Candidatus Fokinia solitaria]|nr:DNA-directed RNA polymerase subunit alpha [Candidatus Fokinia solitaria]
MHQGTSIFQISPLRKGFGITIGNALRRVLMSSIWGSAMICLRIEGLEHEFSQIHGMREDTVDFIHNLRQLSFIVKDGGTHKCSLKISRGGDVTARDVSTPDDVVIVNQDAHLCTLAPTFNGVLEVDFVIKGGYGYSTSDENRALHPDLFQDTPIYCDSSFSPVRNCFFEIEEEILHDTLKITLETNLSIAADIALGVAARILQHNFAPIINFEESKSEESVSKTTATQTFDKKLFTLVSNLQLSVRSHNCLSHANIKYIGDLVIRREADLLKMTNFGKKSLSEIKGVLRHLGLDLCMTISGWPPENVDAIAKSASSDNNIDLSIL